MAKNVPLALKRLPAVKQRQLDVLLEKNSEGKISPKEWALLKALVQEVEQLMAANAKRLVELAKPGRNAAPTNAVRMIIGRNERGQQPPGQRQ